MISFHFWNHCVERTPGTRGRDFSPLRSDHGRLHLSLDVVWKFAGADKEERVYKSGTANE